MRDGNRLRDVNAIRVNINQIARKVNFQNKVTERDVDELKVQYEKSFEVHPYSDANVSDNTDKIAFKYINQINEIDVRADIFRYPINSKLEVYFADLKEFGVENVFEFFMEILNLLDAVDGMMSVHNEWKADMEYEVQQCYSDYYNNSDY